MRAVSVTDRGGRKNNEDFLCHAQADKLWCFVLCDGLGGHAGGEVASEIAARAACDAFKAAPRLSAKAAEEYLEKAADALIRARAERPELCDMSTTASLLLTDGNEAVWAHIGDSRIYYLQNGEISFVTDDHSVAFMEFESGKITYDQIRKSPNRNKLFRCMGGADGGADVSEVIEPRCGDAFLICSDGFWEYVSEDCIEKTFKASASPKEWLREMLSVLHENETETNDNYSAFAVML